MMRREICPVCRFERSEVFPCACGEYIPSSYVRHVCCEHGTGLFVDRRVEAVLLERAEKAERTLDEARSERNDALARVKELEAEVARLKESTIAPGSDDEWMRLFGMTWYSEEYHQKVRGALQRECDEARAWAAHWRDTACDLGNQEPLPWEDDDGQ